jgi:hypothetical protein
LGCNWHKGYGPRNEHGAVAVAEAVCSGSVYVDDTLAALPWPYRRRLVLTLQSQQAYSPDPDVQRAAEFFQLKAARVWAAMPFQGHSAEDTPKTTVLVEHRSRRPAAPPGKGP